MPKIMAKIRIERTAIIMDIMEEGNMADRVRILLQRDTDYYSQHHTVLQETLCLSTAGGTLDYPKVVSFVSAKLVSWWDAEYQAAVAYHCSRSKESDNSDTISTGKMITLSDFVSIISQSVPKVIDHLHALTQEALDHADVSVLIATIGAANLLKNKLWMYDQSLRKYKSKNSLKEEFKLFKTMSEALAERLLDLHCRLICLYILQDIDSLDWACNHPFFEGEMSSFVIRMWWLYMQGIKDDLWNTVPSATAVQVLKGAMNETLTVLTSRYAKAQTTYARNDLIVADVSNLLLCVYKLLPFVCDTVDNIFGTRITVYDICDLHVKCHYLLCQLVLRAASMSTLYKIFKDGTPVCFKSDRVDILGDNPIQPWIIFAAMQDGENIPANARTTSSLSESLNVKLHLNLLLSNPRCNWVLLMEILLMNSCWVPYEILRHCSSSAESEIMTTENRTQCCEGLLCSKQCSSSELCHIEEALVRILINLGKRLYFENTLIKLLEEDATNSWSIHFDGTQIWNNNIPRWIRGMLFYTDELIEQVVKSILAKATNELAPPPPENLIEECVESITTLVDCLPYGLFVIASMMEEILPADVHPLANFIIAQLLAISLYNKLGNENPAAEVLCLLSSSTTGLEDPIIQKLQNSINKVNINVLAATQFQDTEKPEILVEKVLSENGGRIVYTKLYVYLQNESTWLQTKAGCKIKSKDSTTLLYKMFHIFDNPYDQVLSGLWTPNWLHFMKLPLGLTRETAWNILSMRPEFASNAKALSQHDSAVVNYIKSFLIKSASNST